MTKPTGKLILAAAVSVVLISTANGDDVAQSSVVKIEVESYSIDFERPWIKNDYVSGSGSGVIIKDAYILTAAHVVDHPLLIKVTRAGQAENYEASIAFINDEADLAVLVVADDEFFKQSRPIGFGKPAHLGDEVSIYGFPLGGDQVALTRGVISRIDSDRYAHSGHWNLVYQTDAAINAGASGGPAISGGRLIGLSFQGYDELDNTGYIIPISVVEQFLKDIEDGQVDGLPGELFLTQSIENDQLREYLQLPEGETGVLVRKQANRKTVIALLREDDVITEIDGMSIADDHTIEVSKGERAIYFYYITQQQVGDSINLKVWRNAGWVNVRYPLTKRLSDIYSMPHHGSLYVPDYLIIGGIVFTELSYDYLNLFVEGSTLFDQYTDDVIKDYATERAAPIVVSERFPHEINQGYEFEEEILKSFNGKPVASLSELRTMLSENKQPWITLGFEPTEAVIVFSKQQLLKARDEIIDFFDLEPENVF